MSERSIARNFNTELVAGAAVDSANWLLEAERWTFAIFLSAQILS
jgi:hypothetical protein